MSGTSAGWSPERRAANSVKMAERNRDPEFIAKRSKGAASWTPERREQKRAQMVAQNADPAYQARKLAGIAKAKLTPRPLVIPDHTHPLVRGLYTETNEQLATMRQLSERTGADYSAMLSWRKHMPRLDSIDAAGNALDLELAWVPRGTRDENGFAFPKKKKRQHNTGDVT